jgi:hypothetical protein
VTHDVPPPAAGIPYHDVVPLLIAACPSFEDSPEAHSYEPGLGEFILMASFVSHLIRLIEAGQTHSFSEVFQVAERILLEGDPEARSLVADGFLRDLGSDDMYEGSSVRPADFLAWLWPESGRELDT